MGKNVKIREPKKKKMIFLGNEAFSTLLPAAGACAF